VTTCVQALTLSKRRRGPSCADQLAAARLTALSSEQRQRPRSARQLELDWRTLAEATECPRPRRLLTSRGLALSTNRQARIVAGGERSPFEIPKRRGLPRACSQGNDRACHHQGTLTAVVDRLQPPHGRGCDWFSAASTTPAVSARRGLSMCLRPEISIARRWLHSDPPVSSNGRVSYWNDGPAARIQPFYQPDIRDLGIFKANPRASLRPQGNI